jgi:thiol:disulfide interchange protein
MLILAAATILAVAACDQSSAVADKDSAAGGSSMGEIAWVREDYDKALAQANSDGKLMMIDVYTEWCAPCKQMEKDTFPQKDVVDKAANFVSVKLDAEKGQGPKIAKDFQVEGFPTILFIDGKGKLVHSVLGYRNATELVAEMDKALSKAG